jgi:alkylhydroperoxidase family enzyme
MVAHGAVLRSRFFTSEQVEAIAADFHNAGLDPADVAIMDYARKIALNAYKVAPEDIDNLRAHGLSDPEILDVALAASARSFFSKTLDAAGAEPDAEYLGLEPSLLRQLAVGRPFAPDTPDKQASNAGP